MFRFAQALGLAQYGQGAALDLQPVSQPGRSAALQAAGPEGGSHVGRGQQPGQRGEEEPGQVGSPSLAGGVEESAQNRHFGHALPAHLFPIANLTLGMLDFQPAGLKGRLKRFENEAARPAQPRHERNGFKLLILGKIAGMEESTEDVADEQRQATKRGSNVLLVAQ